jgi:hypothetical protein
MRPQDRAVNGLASGVPARRPRIPPVATGAPTSGAPATAREPAPAALGTGGRVVLAVLLAAGFAVALPSALGLVFFAPYAVVGALLAIRRPGNSIGWLLVAIGCALALLNITPIDATAEQFASGTAPWSEAVIAVLSGGATVKAVFLLLFALAVVFPSGRLPGGRWVRILRVVLAFAVGLIVLSAFAPTISVTLSGSAQATSVANPIAIAPTAPIWRLLDLSALTLPVVILMVCGTVSLVVRYRRADGIERQQLRWVVAAIAFLVAAIPGGLVVSLLVPSLGDSGSGLAWIGAMVGFPLIPVAAGIAILRYRLYEIDRIISRTIGWAAVTAVLGAVFVTLVLVAQAGLAPVTGSNTLAVAAATLVVAALFQPLRRRVQALVDRRFYRSRYDAELIVMAFASRLRDEVDLTTTRLEILAAVDATVRPTSMGLWLRGRDATGRAMRDAAGQSRQ